MAETIIHILFETEAPEQETLCALITTCAEAALRAEGIDFPAQIDVTVVDDSGILALNAAHRGKDTVTDVLSFPLYEYLDGEPQESLAGEADPENGRILLGDMILNYRRACEQAAEFGHSPARECGYLTVHSCLHILGYDHERGEAAQRTMREKEEEILRGVGLTRT